MFATLKAIGAIYDEQLMTFRRFGSPIQGHPVPLPDMPWVDVATGSLGQGLPIALGMALAHEDGRLPARVWCLLGDSESAEGSVWEAIENASYHGADNLIGILDMNRLGQRGPTMLEWDIDAYAERARAFGWHAVEVDGHDVAAIDAAFTRGRGRGPPLAGRRPDPEGPRRLVPRGPGGLARQGALGGGRARDRGARRRRDLRISPPKARGGRAAARTAPTVRLPVVRRRDRHAQGVRRDARRARRPAGGRRDRRRGRELHAHRGLPEGRARAVRRELHRRAEHGRHGGRPAGARQDRRSPRRSRVLHARVRLRPDGGDQPGEPPAVGLARRRLDRRGRPVADGARGPRDDARGPRLDRALPERRQLDRQARRRDGRAARDLVPADDAREDAGPVRRERGVPDRRRASLRSSGEDRVAIVGGGDHTARGARGGRGARRRRDPGAGDRLRTRSSRSTPPRSGPRSPRPASSSPSRTTGSRAASATPCWPPSPPRASSPAGSSRSASARCRGPGRPRSSATGRASRRRGSRGPRATSSR